MGDLLPTQLLSARNNFPFRTVTKSGKFLECFEFNQVISGNNWTNGFELFVENKVST